jgi:hypothetical protein
METKYIALANGRGSLPLSEKGYATAVAMGGEQQQLQLHLQVAAALEATGWVASTANIRMVAGGLPAIRSWAALLS